MSDTTANLPAIPAGTTPAVHHTHPELYPENLHPGDVLEWNETGDGEAWRFATQSAWDRHQVRQLQAVQECVDDAAAGDGTPDSVLVRNMLLRLGHPQAAHDHMEATRAEDERSIYALMVREREAQVIKPTQVHTPGRRRKPATPKPRRTT